MNKWQYRYLSRRPLDFIFSQRRDLEKRIDGKSSDQLSEACYLMHVKQKYFEWRSQELAKGTKGICV